MTRRLGVLIPGVLFLLTACSQPGTQTAAVDPARSPSLVATGLKPASATLKDGRNDAGSGDLTSVHIDRTSDQLQVTYQLVDALPTTGTTGVFLDVSKEKDTITRNAGVMWLNGEQFSYFVLDPLDGPRTELDGVAKVDGNKITATFPLLDFVPLGDRWRWSARVLIGGDDVDFCPDPGDDSLNRKTGILQPAATTSVGAGNHGSLGE